MARVNSFLSDPTMAAQNAINTPGIAFGVHWRIHFTLQGVVHDLTADQLLRGVDFRSI